MQFFGQTHLLHSKSIRISGCRNFIFASKIYFIYFTLPFTSVSKTYFFYFTLPFLLNTHVSLSIIRIYSNKIFIFTYRQPNQPPSSTIVTPKPTDQTENPKLIKQKIKNTSTLFLTHFLELLDSHRLDPSFFLILSLNPTENQDKKMSNLGGASMVGQNPQRVTASEEALEFETSKEVKVVTSFADMGIKDDLLCGIYQYGFKKPSAIQQRIVVPIPQGRDVNAQAQSGTGKTSMICWTEARLRDQR